MRLVVLNGGEGKRPKSLSKLRVPCRGCKKTVCFAPQSKRDRFGVRCLYCFGAFCTRCGTKHFRRRKPERLRPLCRFIPRRGRPIEDTLKRMDRKLTQLLKRKR